MVVAAEAMFNFTRPAIGGGSLYYQFQIGMTAHYRVRITFSRRKPGLVQLEFELLCLGSLILAYSPRLFLL